MRVHLLAWFAPVLLAACAGGNAASQLAQAPRFEPKDQAKCGVAKSQARPLIVEWPSADRLTLENKIHEGVVAVRYTGCEMEVLERCTVDAGYKYLAATRSEDKVVIRDQDDLYAKLPVGAARLEGKLARSGRLTVDMDLVGRYEADKPVIRKDQLRGACTGATHFVYGAAVGAFDFYAGADASVGGGAGIGGAGVNARSQAQRETLTKNGDPGACAKAGPGDAAPPAQCGAVIRLEVVPLESTMIATAAGVPAPSTTPGATQLDPPPPPPADASQAQEAGSLAPWVLTGVGSAAMAGGLTLFLLGAPKVSAAAAECPTATSCPTSAANDGNTGRSLEAAGEVTGAIGLAAFAGGLIWHFVSKGGRSTSVYTSPAIAPGFAGLSLGGTL